MTTTSPPRQLPDDSQQLSPSPRQQPPSCRNNFSIQPHILNTARTNQHYGAVVVLPANRRLPCPSGNQLSPRRQLRCDLLGQIISAALDRALGSGKINGVLRPCRLPQSKVSGTRIRRPNSHSLPLRPTLPLEKARRLLLQPGAGSSATHGSAELHQRATRPVWVSLNQFRFSKFIFADVSITYVFSSKMPNCLRASIEASGALKGEPAKVRRPTDLRQLNMQLTRVPCAAPHGTLSPDTWEEAASYSKRT